MSISWIRTFEIYKQSIPNIYFYTDIEIYTKTLICVVKHSLILESRNDAYKYKLKLDVDDLLDVLLDWCIKGSKHYKENYKELYNYQEIDYTKFEKIRENLLDICPSLNVEYE